VISNETIHFLIDASKSMEILGKPVIVKNLVKTLHALPMFDSRFSEISFSGLEWSGEVSDLYKLFQDNVVSQVLIISDAFFDDKAFQQFRKKFLGKGGRCFVVVCGGDAIANRKRGDFLAQDILNAANALLEVPSE
jgi:hypothetical protein